MKFAYRAPQDCADMLLGHSLTVGKSRLRKGHWLTQSDIDAIVQTGIQSVFAGAPEPGDVLENDAAEKLAVCVAGDHVTCEKPHTGRVNLCAARDGVLVYDREALIALNMQDERITLAMLPPYSPVAAGDIVGTIKIIPFAVPDAALEACCSLPGTSELATVAPFLNPPAHMLTTTLSDGKVPQKVVVLTQDRLKRLQIELSSHATGAHHPAPVAEWIKDQPAGLLLIFAASATVDSADVIPEAIRLAGGTVERVGMPADPGNLLVLGHRGQQRIIGLPGCAKSPALNGFDWVLERCAAGLDISPKDWAEMAVGGLLKEIPTRPQPRRRAPVDAQE